MRRWLWNQKGFTMAELLVVTAVTGLALGGVLMLQQRGQQAYLFGASRVETQQNARVALDLMTRELRSATITPAVPSGIVAIPGATDMTFLDQCGNSVRYLLSGTTLNRTGAAYTDRAACTSSGAGTVALIGGVHALTMAYANAAGAATTDPAQVRTVRVRVTTRTEEGPTGGPVRQGRAVMESTIRLRGTLQ